MKNKYKIDGEVVYIYIDSQKYKDGFTTMVSKQSLEKLQKFNVKWCIKYQPNNKSFYVQAVKYIGKKPDGSYKYKTYYLHRFILDVEDAIFVDHINHDTLDNTLTNLNIVEGFKNSINRKSKNSNNSTGYRNVSWIERDQKYVVQLQINGKNTKLGEFDDVDEAGKFAEEMRKKYYAKIYENIGC